MANRNAPYGFRAVAGPMRCREYTLASGNTAIGIGDLIAVTTAGTVDQAAASATQIIGVALSSHAANSGAQISISDHPDTIYVARTDGSSGGGGTDLKALTAMFGNANFVATAQSNGVSQMTIDQDTGATTSTLPLKVLRLHKKADNSFGDYNELECIINNHVEKSLGVTGLA